MTEQQKADGKKFPDKLRAVLRILTVDDELRAKALPHVDIANRTINWLDIWANEFASQHKTALLFAAAIWNDSQGDSDADLVEQALSLDANLLLAVHRALAMRWGLKR